MNALARMVRLVFHDQKFRWLQALSLGVLVVLAGTALLGLSGWFIVSAGAAGLAGTAAGFDYFRPSAGVRFLALGRTATRYGERLVSHDITLRTLARLRVRVLETMTHLDYRQMIRVRPGATLNRLTADIDALDGITLTLVLPVLTAVLSLMTSAAALSWLTDWSLALACTTLMAAGSLAVLIGSARRSILSACRAEVSHQSVRARTIDLMRARTELVISAAITPAIDRLGRTILRQRRATQTNHQTEQKTAFALNAVTTTAAAAAFWLGAGMTQSGLMSPALAALAFFAILSLSETVGPLRRAAAQLGRMALAAHRVDNTLAQPAPVSEPPAATETVANQGQTNQTPTTDRQVATTALLFDAISYRTADSEQPILHKLSLKIDRGEKVALIGPSGAGKSTVLNLAAGLVSPQSGEVLCFGNHPDSMNERSLREQLGLLSQRSTLFAGSIRSTLEMARNGSSDEQLWQVLDAVSLSQVIRDKGGLDFALGEAGSGLSGGEKRRLALARTLLRGPELLLLDEPTEGLDESTAQAVLEGIGRYLPNATILMASHRPAEAQWVDRTISMS